MSTEIWANCKDCGNIYSYSNEWATSLKSEGRDPPEYCPRCRTIRAIERNSVAMPYFKAIPTVPRRPDNELSVGRLGRLIHYDRYHRLIEKKSKYFIPGSDIDFGIKDNDVINLFKILDKNKVTVVVGPTGSGKSTFLPFRLINTPQKFRAKYPEDYFTKFGQVIVTQPRVQATRKIADFVAKDLQGCTLGAGGDVGYVHHDDRSADSHSKLIFCTDGTLINWILDGQIANFSIIVIDEAHERSLNIDLILGLLKLRLPLYPNLKLIIASATINEDQFINHYKDILNVGFKDFKGLKIFDYKRIWSLENVCSEPRTDPMLPYVVHQTLEILRGIAQQKLLPIGEKKEKVPAPEGDILIFLPTVDSINITASSLKERINDDPLLRDREIRVYPLHRKIPLEIQDKALEKKSSTIAIKVFDALDGFQEKGQEGRILGLVLDKKSVQETIQKIQKLVEADPQLSKIPINQFSKRIQTKNDNENNLSVDIATHEEIHGLDISGYTCVCFDRKVVISTNIAETSLTVDGIVYVVDSGLITMKEWDRDTLNESFPIHWHSQDGCRQRWGRAGRVRDGWAYCLYTKEQYDNFIAHTDPEIERAPLEEAILKAKQAGIDNVFDFPWLKKPDEKELERALIALEAYNLIDSDGDLTPHGENVSKLIRTPSIGHAISLADQLACAVEVCTLLHLLDFNLQNDIFLWYDQWDGYTRKIVRKIHEGLRTGCNDDLEFLLKLFQCWYESSENNWNWITGEPFKILWPNRIPDIPEAAKLNLNQKQTEKLLAGVRSAVDIDEFDRIELPEEAKKTLSLWFVDVKAAYKDTRREAWSNRFFINHSTMKIVEKERNADLEKLSIGKKTIESRSLHFGMFLDRVRLLLAYAWPDRIYRYKDGRYSAQQTERQKVEKNLSINLGQNSTLNDFWPSHEAFIFGKRRINSRGGYIEVGWIIQLKQEWLNALNLPFLQFSQWIAKNNQVNQQERNKLRSALVFLDQWYPIGCKFICNVIAKKNTENNHVSIKSRQEPFLLVNPTTFEGTILYAEDLSDNLESDLDEKAGKDIFIQSVQESEEDGLIDSGDESEENFDQNIVSAGEIAAKYLRENVKAIFEPARTINEKTLSVEVIGFSITNIEQSTTFELKVKETHEDFAPFAKAHKEGQMIEVQILDFEKDPFDEQTNAVIVKTIDFDYQMVMDIQDFSFSGRKEQFANLKIGQRFQAQIFEIDVSNQRVYLSAHAPLEELLPEKGDKLNARVLSDSYLDKGGYLELECSNMAKAIFPPTVYISPEHIPQSIGNMRSEEIFQVRILGGVSHSVKISSLPKEFIQMLEKAKWKNLIRWDEGAKKLSVDGRLTFEQQKELLEPLNEPLVRRAIREIYRLSNMLQGEILITDQIAAFEKKYQSIEKNTIIPDARVVKVLDFGAFFEIPLADDGGRSIQGLVFKSEMAVGGIENPKEFLKVGDVRKVIVINKDLEKQQIELSMIMPENRPVWKYKIGQITNGIITGVKPYGVFIELEPHVDGLLHKSQMAQRFEINEELYKVGNKIIVQIKNINSKGEVFLTTYINEQKIEKKIGEKIENRQIIKSNSSVPIESELLPELSKREQEFKVPCVIKLLIIIFICSLFFSAVSQCGNNFLKQVSFPSSDNSQNDSSSFSFGITNSLADCPNAPSTRMAIGMKGRVTYRNNVALMLRSEARIDKSTFIKDLREGTRFEVINGPVCADGYIWWNIKTREGAVGWSAEGNKKVYYMEPFDW